MDHSKHATRRHESEITEEPVPFASTFRAYGTSGKDIKGVPPKRL